MHKPYECSLFWELMWSFRGRGCCGTQLVACQLVDVLKSVTKREREVREEWMRNTDEEWNVMNRSRLFSFCPHSLFCSFSCKFCVFNDYSGAAGQWKSSKRTCCSSFMDLYTSLLLSPLTGVWMHSAVFSSSRWELFRSLWHPDNQLTLLLLITPDMYHTDARREQDSEIQSKNFTRVKNN